MKKLAIAVVALGFLAACDDPNTAKRTLSQMGYTDIEITGYSLFGCGKDDDFHTGFAATSPNGLRVTGVVCSGWLKGATVRFN